MTAVGWDPDGDDACTGPCCPTPPAPVLGAESLVDVERLVDEEGEPLCTCTYGERCPNCRD